MEGLRTSLRGGTCRQCEWQVHARFCPCCSFASRGQLQSSQERHVLEEDWLRGLAHFCCCSRRLIKEIQLVGSTCFLGFGVTLKCISTCASTNLGRHLRASRYQHGWIRRRQCLGRYCGCVEGQTCKGSCPLEEPISSLACGNSSLCVEERASKRKCSDVNEEKKRCL